MTKLGNAKVRRTGFVLVPSFSGTAHSYTGATLSKAIVDCLSFCGKPTQEEMTKSYVSISRVRRADDLLIAQPFSPAFFRLGVMTGPHLLLKRLRQEIGDDELEEEWKARTAAYSSVERTQKNLK